MKAKIKQKAMRERKLAREENDDDEDVKQKRTRYINDEQVEDESGDDEGVDALDSEEMVYDSEEEALEEKEYQERQ